MSAEQLAKDVQFAMEQLEFLKQDIDEGWPPEELKEVAEFIRLNLLSALEAYDLSKAEVRHG